MSDSRPNILFIISDEEKADLAAWIEEERKKPQSPFHP